MFHFVVKILVINFLGFAFVKNATYVTMLKNKKPSHFCKGLFTFLDAEINSA